MRSLAFLLILAHSSFAIGLLPIIGGISSATLPFIYDKYKDSLCYVTECCKEAISFDEANLTQSLLDNVYGQKFALKRIIALVKAHLNNPSPLKPLVLSFHGSNGVGKTYAATRIVDSIYKQGTKSKYYHFFDSSRDFLHKSKIEEYKDYLVNFITQASQRCERSFFIFDEVNKMPPSVLDAVTPFLGYRDEIEGHNYRKNIFIFISNTGGTSINNYIYNTHLEGIDRYDIDYRDLSKKIISEAFLTEGGLKMSDMINHHFISDVIIFLPLDVGHVELCIKEIAKRRGITLTATIIEDLKSELLWFPEDSQLFSVSGCKLVSDKIGLFI